MVMANITCRIPKDKAADFIVPFEKPVKVEKKWCPQCRRWRLIKDFNKNKNKHDGLGTECRRCATTNYRKWKLQKA